MPTFRSTTYIEKERNVLDLFTVEGEGGYRESNFTFMFKSSAFFNTNILPSVKNVCAVDTDIKSVVVGTETFNFLPNVLRISLGNQNACIMYRNGDIDIGGTRTSFPYLAGIMPNVRDTFTPSTYATGGIQYKQLLLLKNKDLVLIDCNNKTNTLLLSNVSKFLTKNQGHRCDAIVGMVNGDVYHVWIGPSPTSSTYNDGNDTNTGCVKINGLKHTDLLFCTIGDPPCDATFCKKSEPNKIYRFIKGYSTNFQIKGIETTPIASMTLTDPKEYYIHGMAQEFNALYLTNKRLIHKSSADGGGSYSVGYTASDWQTGWEYDVFAHTDILYPKRICTPTAYSMIIEDAFGKYWLCGNNGYVLAQPIRYTFFNNLKTYLDPIRLSI